MPRVALATCGRHPRIDEEQRLTNAALDLLGIEYGSEVWNDPSVPWEDYDLVVVRTTWDYTDHLEEFLRWVERCQNIENSATVLSWNTDKQYFDDLQASGVPITPTAYVRSHDEFFIPDSERFVVKPTVGAGARGVERFDWQEGDRARQHVAELLSLGRVAMVQPYLELVETGNEIGIIFIDEVFSHGIEKSPLLNAAKHDRAALLRGSAISLREPTQGELAVALQALKATHEICGITQPMLYARVDLLPSEEGPVVVELELTEPSMYFACETSAADQFAQAIAGRL